MTKSIKRRSVLKAIGASSSVAATGAVAARRADIDSVHLVEAGVKFDVPSDHSYFWAQTDGVANYYVDEARKRLLLAPHADEAESALAESDTVTASPDLKPAPNQVSSDEQTHHLPTSLLGYNKPNKRVNLAEPTTLPEIRVESADGQPRLFAGKKEMVLSPDTTGSFELESQVATATTSQVTDEVVEVDGIPDDRQGPRKEFDSVRIEATPIVKYRYITDLQVMKAEGTLL